MQIECSRAVQPARLDLLERGESSVDGGEVAPDHLLALAAVALLDRVLDRRDRLLDGQHAREREEAGLQDGVHTSGQAGLPRDPLRIDDEEAELLVDDLLLDSPRQLPPAVEAVRAREQDGRARTCVLEHVEALEQLELVAGDEVGFLDQVRRVDRVVAEAQMRDRHRPRLLRVVDEVRLHVTAGFLGDDLGRVLVRADRAVGAESVEEAADRLSGHAPGRVVVEARAGDVVVDADGEVTVRPHIEVAVHVLEVVLLRAGQLFEHGAGHRRRELLRAQPVAAADHGPRQPLLLVQGRRRRPRTEALRPLRSPWPGRARPRTWSRTGAPPRGNGWRRAGRGAP